MTALRCVVVALGLVLAGCSEPPVAPTGNGAVAPNQAQRAAQTQASADSTVQPIGEARMLPDNSIELNLSTTQPDGSIAHGLVTYKPSDPRYRSTLEHIGAIEPGERKPVYPWPPAGKPGP